MSKISIITVNYNNSHGLKRTIESVISQNDSKYEYIIVDGNSDDDSLKVIKEYSDFINVVHSGPDSGVYDAMNKGIDLATGEWLVFLNSGDVFYDTTVLSNIQSISNLQEFSFLYGDKVEHSSGKLVKALNHETIKTGVIFACHQSMFFRKSNIKYDLRYKIYSDYDFVCKYYLEGGKFLYLDCPISVFEGGGLSSSISFQKRLDKYRSVLNNFGFLALLRAVVNRVKG